MHPLISGLFTPGLLTTGLLTTGLLASLTLTACGADPAPRPDIRMLPVTTGGIANSLIRTYHPDEWGSRQNMTYVQNYTSSLAVSRDGTLYTNTTWEEGHRAAGTYRAGDCLPDHADFGTGSGDTVAVGERLVAYGHWGKVILIERSPGQALDGHGGRTQREIVVSPGDKPPQISGLALDETRGRIWVATATNGQVRCFALDGAPIAIQPIMVPRVAGLAVDHTGSLWAVQSALARGQAEITGNVFAAPSAAGHGAEHATNADDKAWYQAAAADGFCGIELAQPTALVGLRFVGGGESVFTGGAIEVSAVGKDGPWTMVTTIAREPAGWPDTYVTLPSTQPLAAVRIRGPKIGVRKLALFALVAPQPGAVLPFAADGRPLPQRLPVTNPTGISSDPARQRLLVSTDRPDHQVLGFTGLDRTPVLDPAFGNQGRFGAQGGVFAGTGATIGSIGPQRFDQVRGAGSDAQGNLYVAMVGSMGLSQTRFESYDPSGALRWRLSGLSFIDAADLDPADETSLWSATNRFRMDYTKPAGDEWTHTATTVDGARFPDDARTNAFTQQVFGIRRIHGVRFLITTVAVNEFAFYRFAEKTGDLGIPCAVFAPWHTGRAWPAHQPVGNTSFIWQDRNGNGATEPDEFSKDPKGGVRTMAWIDDAGNHWSNANNTIQCLHVAPALDQFGAPHWDFTSPDNRIYPIPAPFIDGELRALRVVDDKGPVYLCGFTKDQRNALGGNVPMGRVLVRYAQQGEALVEQARVTLPYDIHFGTEWIKETRDQAAAISVAGDYVFVGYQRTMNTVVYRADTLALVGRIDVGQQVHTPLIDGPAEMIVRKRSSTDEYLLFYPMYVGNATTLVRWKPTDTTWLPSPAKVRVAAANVAWDAVAGASGYRLERKDLIATGWGPWQSAGETTGTTLHDAKAPTDAAGHCWRVRALGATPSDWSFSAFQRK